MAGRLDRVLVIDVEATCWEGPPPPGQEAEIIEIGLCVLDVESGARLHRESILVQPERSEVSPFCTELTTLRPAQLLRDGVSFERACRILHRKHRAGDRAWASFGDYDRRQFMRQCDERGVAYPFGETHLNVKNMFALAQGLRREVGLLSALKLAALEYEGTHHRGVDDAWNAASLLAKMLSVCRLGLTP